VTAVTEWGICYEPELTRTVVVIGTGPDNERRARHEVRCWPETATLVCRTVTYGPWEPAGNHSAPAADVRED
jgi:hypothetical protein